MNTMTARIPGKKIEVEEVQLAGKMCHAPGMFMSPMKHDNGPSSRRTFCRPMAIKKRNAIVGCEAGFQHEARGTHIHICKRAKSLSSRREFGR